MNWTTRSILCRNGGPRGPHRERIFLELTGRGWREWSTAVTAALAEIPSDDPDAVAVALARSFAQRPLLCDLIPHTALNLERQASIETVRAYKLTSLGAVGRAAAALAGPLPELSAEDRRELVSAVALLDLEPRLTRATRVTIAGLRAVPSSSPGS